jgi:hypothetical protein
MKAIRKIAIAVKGPLMASSPLFDATNRFPAGKLRSLETHHNQEALI